MALLSNRESLASVKGLLLRNCRGTGDVGRHSWWKCWRWDCYPLVRVPSKQGRQKHLGLVDQACWGLRVDRHFAHTGCSYKGWLRKWVMDEGRMTKWEWLSGVVGKVVRGGKEWLTSGPVWVISCAGTGIGKTVIWLQFIVHKRGSGACHVKWVWQSFKHMVERLR